jgi:DNA-binding helix-hairpin-helix protein with protein kinase domain
VALQNGRILNLAAWPVAVLRTRVNGDIAGFAMPNIRGYKDVHLLYSPKSRVRDFPPKVNWAFLVHAAANIARAFSVVHEQGHVIGDVNERNLKVSPDSAVVNLIDCDSFQIRAETRYFLCEVGVPTYTPAELQETQAFRTVIRTANHDNFGLAVLIFHLLFMGRHPFAGRFLGKGEMPIERAICEHRFAYAPDNRLTQMQPPPNCLSLSQVSPMVADLFLRAFSSSGVNNGRPSASSWTTALTSLEADLKKCGTNPAHEFFKGISECPWCSIEGHTGVTLFVGAVSYDTASGFRLDIVWMRIQGVQGPGPAVAPDLNQIRAQIRANPAAKRAGWKRRVTLTSIVAAMICAVVVAAFAFGAGAIWVAFIAIGAAQAVWERVGKQRERYQADQRIAENNFRSIQERWKTDASDVKFQQKFVYLSNLRTQHLEIPKLRKSKLQELERNLRQTQLRSYLEKFSISSAGISNIGVTRKAMLASYNIDTAADVTLAAVDAVPGFGQFLTAQLLDWRRALESKFVFNPNRGIDPEDLRALDKEIVGKRVALESSLLKGASDLTALANQIMAARLALTKDLENAARELCQAEANTRAA